MEVVKLGVVLFLLINLGCIEYVDSQQNENLKANIYFLHIQSDIKFRFATTLITSKVVNPHPDAIETTFDVTLPDQAFITDFKLEIDGRLYPGKVDEKERANRKYQKARRKGISAGQVKQRPRETNKFQVSVNVAAQSKVTFNLTYQELLYRSQGTYEHVIYIDPGQTVDDFKIDVFIQESRHITNVYVPPLRNDVLIEHPNRAINELVVIERPSERTAKVKYYPTVYDQLLWSQEGLEGLFIIEYDIERNFDAGDVLVVDGFFVHFFSPTGMDPIPKDVLFILDTSSSMAGTKIEQLRDAMHIILGELHEGDKFNIIKFSREITFWRPGTVMPANRRFIAEAQSYVKAMYPLGFVRQSAKAGTNINKAMVDGLTFLNNLQQEQGRVKLLMFLTDGEPTRGVEDIATILTNVRKNNPYNIPIFSLAFGDDADYEFVKKVALQNDGISRKIYEESDAVLQISGFYDEISRAALRNVSFKYLDANTEIQNLTKSSYQSFFSDSEIIVSGKLTSDVKMLTIGVQGEGVSGAVELSMTSDARGDIITHSSSLTKEHDFQNITQKIWAYLTIRQLLDDAVGENDPEVKDDLKHKVTDLSMKYSFVTPLTSMVVTKPEARDVGFLEEGEDAQLARDSPSNPAPPPFRPFSRSRGQSRGGGGGGDPHFMIRILGMDYPVCFDIAAEPGNVLRMLKDPVSRITINAEIIKGLHKNHHGGYRTYIGKLVFMVPRFVIVVTPGRIVIDGTLYSWNSDTPFKSGRYKLLIASTDNDVRILHIDFGNRITVSVKRHMAQTVLQVDFLNIYIDNEEGLSPKADGILGQFHRKRMVLKKEVINTKGESIGKIAVKDGKRRSRLKAKLKERHDLISGKIEKCWNINKDIKSLLQDKYFCKYVFQH